MRRDGIFRTAERSKLAMTNGDRKKHPTLRPKLKHEAGQAGRRRGKSAERRSKVMGGHDFSNVWWGKEDQRSLEGDGDYQGPGFPGFDKPLAMTSRDVPRTTPAKKKTSTEAKTASGSRIGDYQNYQGNAGRALL